MTAGGCACGAVRYALADAPIFVNACHCRDCQRLTGSAFALNGMIETAALSVTAGDPHERDDAGGRAWFCATCAVLLWADHPLFGDHARFVRLGTLDRGEAFAPDAHFFTRSTHPWIVLPAGVPAHETLPGPEESGAALPADRQVRMDALQRRCGRETKPG